MVGLIIIIVLIIIITSLLATFDACDNHRARCFFKIKNKNKISNNNNNKQLMVLKLGWHQTLIRIICDDL